MILFKSVFVGNNKKQNKCYILPAQHRWGERQGRCSRVSCSDWTNSARNLHPVKMCKEECEFESRRRGRETAKSIYSKFSSTNRSEQYDLPQPRRWQRWKWHNHRTCCWYRRICPDRKNRSFQARLAPSLLSFVGSLSFSIVSRESGPRYLWEKINSRVRKGLGTKIDDQIQSSSKTRGYLPPNSTAIRIERHMTFFSAIRVAS